MNIISIRDTIVSRIRISDTSVWDTARCVNGRVSKEKRNNYTNNNVPRPRPGSQRCFTPGERFPHGYWYFESNKTRVITTKTGKHNGRVSPVVPYAILNFPVFSAPPQKTRRPRCPPSASRTHLHSQYTLIRSRCLRGLFFTTRRRPPRDTNGIFMAASKKNNSFAVAFAANKRFVYASVNRHRLPHSETGKIKKSVRFTVWPFPSKVNALYFLRSDKDADFRSRPGGTRMNGVSEHLLIQRTDRKSSLGELVGK